MMKYGKSGYAISYSLATNSGNWELGDLGIRGFGDWELGKKIQWLLWKLWKLWKYEALRYSLLICIPTRERGNE